MQSSPQPGASPTPPGSAPPTVTSLQPTVRVMRLYKPGMHTISTYVPHLPTQSASNLKSSSSASSREAGCLSDFAVSPFLLLPDSFGDIYMGEVFSAYVAVVNGMQDAPFHHVSLTLRLLATNATHELVDSRSPEGSGDGDGSNSSSSSGSIGGLGLDGSMVGGDASSGTAQDRTLEPNEFTDTVVKHLLTELGTHTLRVSVQYCSHRSTELKTLRKFYRFNVLQPLVVASSCIDVGTSQLGVQCRVTNSTQSAMFIEDARFLLHNEADRVEAVAAPLHVDSDAAISAGAAAADDAGGELRPQDQFNIDSLPLLLPEESYAFSFLVSRPEGWRTRHTPATLRSEPLGHPAVTWCSYMGEHGVVRGEATLITPAAESRPTRSGSSSESTPPPADSRRRTASALGTPANAAPNPSTGLQLIPLSCPSSVSASSEFVVSLLCKNNSSQPASVYLQTHDAASSALPNVRSSGSYNSSKNGLCVTGLTGACLGILGPGEAVETSITVFPLARGLFDLNCLAAVDRHTGLVFPASSLGKIFVQ